MVQMAKPGRAGEFEHVLGTADICQPGFGGSVCAAEAQAGGIIEEGATVAFHPLAGIAVQATLRQREVTLEHDRPRQNLTGGALPMAQHSLDAGDGILLAAAAHDHRQRLAVEQQIAHQIGTEESGGPREQNMVAGGRCGNVHEPLQADGGGGGHSGDFSQAPGKQSNVRTASVKQQWAGCQSAVF